MKVQKAVGFSILLMAFSELQNRLELLNLLDREIVVVIPVGKQYIKRTHIGIVHACDCDTSPVAHNLVTHLLLNFQW